MTVSSGVTVLLTGAAGDVGSAILPALIEAGYDVVALDRVAFEAPTATRTIVGDLQDREVVLDALRGVDRVIHMGAIPSPNGHPADEIFTSNTRSTFLLLDEAGRVGVERAIVASSAAAVGLAWSYSVQIPEYLPLDERHPDLIEDPYGLSKRVVELIAATSFRRWGMPSLLLRFPFIGAGERLAGHLRWFAEEPLASRAELWGWIHTDDVVRAVLVALAGDISGSEIVTVAAPDSGSRIPTAELIAQYFPGIELRGNFAGFDSLYSTDRMRELLNGFEPIHGWRERP